MGDRLEGRNWNSVPSWLCGLEKVFSSLALDFPTVSLASVCEGSSQRGSMQRGSMLMSERQNLTELGGPLFHPVVPQPR